MSSKIQRPIIVELTPNIIFILNANFYYSIYDMIERKMKLLLLLTFVPSTAMLLWFLLQEFISSDLREYFVTTVVIVVPEVLSMLFGKR